MNPSTPDNRALARVRAAGAEAGKVGLALLMWMLGVPGLLVLAYLLFT
jgi:hypothetical protein